jgi:hypothetical protein
VAATAADPEVPWIVGGGWDPDAVGAELPFAAEIDAVVPDRPVLLLSRDGTAAIVNTRALEAAGIGRETPEPFEGAIERDADGVPLGWLGGSAVAIVQGAVPPPTSRQRQAALLRAQAHLHGLGIVGWRDARVTPDDEAAYLELAHRGELSGWVSASLAWDVRRWLEQIPDLARRRAEVADASGSRVRPASVKLVLDGSVEQGTAALIDPYLDAEGHPSADLGRVLHAPEALRDICIALDRERFSIHLHAAGDRAVRDALDALTAARKVNGPRDARHAIAHLQLVDPGDLVRFAGLGVVADCQPAWTSEVETLRVVMRPLVGSHRTESMLPIGSLLRMGAPVALGSDWGVVGVVDPLRILDAAVTRTDPEVPGARPLGPVSERLAPEAALRAATRGAAYATWFDDVSGTLETGRSADLVVLDRDPLDARNGPWRDATVLLTVAAGRIVHEAPGLR